MGTNDNLENRYDAEVSFVAGESPQHTKFNNWDEIIEAAVTLLCSVVGDITWVKKNASYPSFITNLAKAIGDMEKFGPQIVASDDDDYHIWKVSVSEGSYEFKLPHARYLVDEADPTDSSLGSWIISSTNNNWINPANYTGCDTPPSAAGEWELVKKWVPDTAEGTYSSIIRTYSPAPAGSSITYRAIKDGYLNNAEGTYLNLIPTIAQIEDVASGNKGLEVTKLSTTYWCFAFPEHTMTVSGTSLPSATDVNTLVPQIPEWIWNACEGHTTGDLYPDGLFLLWDNIAGVFVTDDDGNFPEFCCWNDGGDTRSRFAISQNFVRKTGDEPFAVGDDSRYVLVMAGTSIGQALATTRNFLGFHDHGALGGSAVHHSALTGLVPKKDGWLHATVAGTHGRYTGNAGDDARRFGPSSLGDHPEYLARAGYIAQDESQNANNVMHGDIRFGTKIPDGAGDDADWETKGENGTETWGASFGDGSAGVMGRAVQVGASTDLRVGITGNMDGDSSNYYGLYNFGGANFLPDAVVSARSHPQDVTGNLNGPRVFSRVGYALVAGAKSIYVEEGTYEISSLTGILLAVDKIHIKGSGPNTIFQAGNATTPCIFNIGLPIAGAKDITISDMTINLENGSNILTEVGIKIGDASKVTRRVTIENVNFIGAASGGVPCIGLGNTSVQTTIRNCRFGGDSTSVGIKGIYALNPNGYFIHNNCFGSAAYACGQAMQELSTAGASGNTKVFSNNEIYSNLSTLGVIGLAGSLGHESSPHVVCYNSVLGSYGGSGIRLESIEESSFIGNRLMGASADYGFYIEACNDLEIKQNKIASATSVGIDITGLVFSEITDNKIKFCGIGIRLGATTDKSNNIKISNNDIDCYGGTTGISSSSSSTPDPTTEVRYFLQISGNKIHRFSNTGIGISDFGACDITGNYLKSKISGISNAIKVSGDSSYSKIDSNFVSLSSTKSGGTFYGIHILDGPTSISNNSIYMTAATSGTAQDLYGVYFSDSTTGVVSKISSNTIFISHLVTTPTHKTGVWVSSGGTPEIKNNTIITTEKAIEATGNYLVLADNTLGTIDTPCNYGLYFNIVSATGPLGLYRARAEVVSNTIYYEISGLSLYAHESNDVDLSLEDTGNTILLSLSPGHATANPITIGNSGAGVINLIRSTISGNRMQTYDGIEAIQIDGDASLSAVGNSCYTTGSTDYSMIYIAGNLIQPSVIVGNIIDSNGATTYALELIGAASVPGTVVDHNQPDDKKP